MPRTYVLTLSCPDQSGLVAAVSQFIATYDGNLIELSQHTDTIGHWFFMRAEIDAASLPFDLDEFRILFPRIADQYNMQWQITDTAINKRVVLLVSKHDHCLADLLYRYRSKDFDFDIPCVISNHNDLKDVVEWHGIPYHHVPIEDGNEAHGFNTMQKLFNDHQADVIVLARYMRILPNDICQSNFGRIINIHHSFLPSFVGAKPYHRAYERGVKLVGATCHYVTPDLDEGPIIDQDVICVNHSHSANDMVRLGRDVEKTVLARALRNHVQDRVLIRGNKTIVFER